MCIKITWLALNGMFLVLNNAIAFDIFIIYITEKCKNVFALIKRSGTAIYLASSSEIVIYFFDWPCLKDTPLLHILSLKNVYNFIYCVHNSPELDTWEFNAGARTVTKMSSKLDFTSTRQDHSAEDTPNPFIYRLYPTRWDKIVVSDINI